MWRCPVMPTLAQWARYLQASGCVIEHMHDLSSLMWPHSEAEIAEELAAIQRRRRWRDRLGLRMVGDAQMGGLLLERLTLQVASRYVMIVARKR
jgi:hypothetical protein